MTNRELQARAAVRAAEATLEEARRAWRGARKLRALWPQDPDTRRKLDEANETLAEAEIDLARTNEVLAEARGADPVVSGPPPPPTVPKPCGHANTTRHVAIHCADCEELLHIAPVAETGSPSCDSCGQDVPTKPMCARCLPESPTRRELLVEDVEQWTLGDDGTLDTVVTDPLGVEHRFSTDTAAEYRDEDGTLNFDRFVREIAIQAAKDYHDDSDPYDEPELQKYAYERNLDNSPNTFRCVECGKLVERDSFEAGEHTAPDDQPTDDHPAVPEPETWARVARSITLSLDHMDKSVLALVLTDLVHNHKLTGDDQLALWRGRDDAKREREEWFAKLRNVRNEAAAADTEQTSD